MAPLLAQHHVQHPPKCVLAQRAVYPVISQALFLIKLIVQAEVVSHSFGTVDDAEVRNTITMQSTAVS